MPVGQLKGCNDVRRGADKIISRVNTFHKVAIIIAVTSSMHRGCVGFFQTNLLFFLKFNFINLSCKQTRAET